MGQGLQLMPAVQGRHGATARRHHGSGPVGGWEGTVCGPAIGRPENGPGARCANRTGAGVEACTNATACGRDCGQVVASGSVAHTRWATPSGERVDKLQVRGTPAVGGAQGGQGHMPVHGDGLGIRSRMGQA